MIRSAEQIPRSTRSMPPLDLGIRVRLAGHRVVAVPGAIVWVERGPADWRAGKDLGSTAMYRLDRQAWLYRRFAYSAWWALIPLILLALPMSFVRQAWQFAVKRPDLAVADLIATLGALWQLPPGDCGQNPVGPVKNCELGVASSASDDGD